MSAFHLLYQIYTYHIAGARKHINTNHYIHNKITIDYYRLPYYLIFLQKLVTNYILKSKVSCLMTHILFQTTGQNPLELWDLAQEQRIKAARSGRKWCFAVVG